MDEYTTRAKFSPDRRRRLVGTETQKFGEICSFCGYDPTEATLYTHQAEIWQGRLHHRFTLAFKFGLDH